MAPGRSRHHKVWNLARQERQMQPKKSPGFRWKPTCQTRKSQLSWYHAGLESYTMLYLVVAGLPTSFWPQFTEGSYVTSADDLDRCNRTTHNCDEDGSRRPGAVFIVFWQSVIDLESESFGQLVVWYVFWMSLSPLKRVSFFSHYQMLCSFSAKGDDRGDSTAVWSVAQWELVRCVRWGLFSHVGVGSCWGTNHLTALRCCPFSRILAFSRMAKAKTKPTTMGKPRKGL